MSGDDIDMDWEELDPSDDDITKVMSVERRNELLSKLRDRSSYKRKSTPPAPKKEK